MENNLRNASTNLTKQLLRIEEKYGFEYFGIKIAEEDNSEESEDEKA